MSGGEGFRMEEAIEGRRNRKRRRRVEEEREEKN